MKKLFWGLLGVLMAVLSYGQDTITESYPGYMFWPHALPLTMPYYETEDTFYTTVQRCDYWEYHATPGCLVYGVSIRGTFNLDSSINVSLAVREGDTMFSYFDTSYLDSSMIRKYFKFEALKCGNMLEYVDKCNEVYFHRPWSMTDEFYVVVRYEADTGRKERLLLYTGQEESPYIQNYFMWSGGRFIVIYDWANYTYHTSMPWGDVFPITEPNPSRCGKPTGLQITGRGAGWVSLAWNSGAGDGYQVTVEGPDDTIVTTTTDTTILLNNLVTEGLYWVRVRSLCRYQYYGYDSTFVNPESASVGIRVSGDGVSELDADPQIGLYPNPADKVVNLSVEEPCEVSLMDVTGRTVLKRQVRPGSNTIDVSTLPDGLYFVKTGTHHSSLIIHH